MDYSDQISNYFHRPFPTSLINRFPLPARVSSYGKELAIDKLEDAARRATGLHDYGDNVHREGFSQLVESALSDNNLTRLGRFFLKSTIVSHLSTKLAVVDAEHKAINSKPQEPEEPPIFILGLPRTGTTILHMLLGLDEGSRHVLGYEAVFPADTPKLKSRNARIKQMDRTMKGLHYLSPLAARLHPVGTHLPQECVVYHAALGQSGHFNVLLKVPQYEDWLLKQSWDNRMAFHKRALAVIAGGNMPKRWVFKTPFYMPAVPDILQHYPGARIIFTHRDPLEVIPSCASLSLALMQMSYDRLDVPENSRFMMNTYANCINKAAEDVQSLGAASPNIYHLHFREMMKDNVAGVRDIYDHFDMDFTPEMQSRMTEFLRPGNHGTVFKHKVSADMFGLSEAMINEAFSYYRRTMQVSEPA